MFGFPLPDDGIMTLRRHDVTTRPAPYIRRDRENPLLQEGSASSLRPSLPPSVFQAAGRTARASHASAKPLHNGSP